MNKWYESTDTDSGLIISSRVRLARNLKKFPFSSRLSGKHAEDMIQEVTSSVMNDITPFASKFELLSLIDMSDSEKISMLEKHEISRDLIQNRLPTALLLLDDRTISIMINEEDHLRIQTLDAGDSLDKCYETADKIDDLIEESVEYAFSKEFGYLTSCPSNIGTGLRASYMVHLPMLTKTERLRPLVQTISKFGLTVRGVYGEGSESLGDIYQISNQVTMGKSEQQIISALKNVTNQILQHEMNLSKTVLENNYTDIEDKVYRSYGIITNSRKITADEASKLLSDIRFGFNFGVLKEKKPEIGLYNILVNIQPATLQVTKEESLPESERDKKRAEYLRQVFAG